MFTPEKRVIRKHDREPLRVTEEYAEKLARTLPERDFEIIQWLLKVPFMTSQQIEMIVFADLKPSSRQTKANERIRKLYHAHCIDRWFPPVGEGAGSSMQHLVLDRAGLLALAKKKGYDTQSDQIKKWRKRNHIPQDYQHRLKIIDFYGMLHLLNRQLGVIPDVDGNDGTVGEILMWEWEHQAKIKFPMRVNDRMQEVWLIPDAFCAYKYNARGGFKFFFLEADNATEEMEVLESKIRRYIAMHESGAWREKRWARSTNGRLFPAVIFLFHEQDKARQLRNFAKRLQSPVRFLFTTYSELIEQEHITYENHLGKKRNVTQRDNIRLLEPIFISSNDEGLVSL